MSLLVLSIPLDGRIRLSIPGRADHVEIILVDARFSKARLGIQAATDIGIQRIDPATDLPVPRKEPVPA